MAGKTPRRKQKKMPYPYGGPGRGPQNKFSNKFYWSSRYLNCEHCGQKVYSSKTNSGKATLMLRHWAHSIFCKEIRAARGIVVDRILSKHDLEWRDVPNLDISDENYEGQREEFGIEAGNDDGIEESSPIDVRLLFRDGKDPTGDGLYPAVTTEGLLFSQTARETLGEYAETNDPYVVDVKSDIADVQREFLRKFDSSADEPPIKFRNRNQKGSVDDVNPGPIGSH